VTRQQAATPGSVSIRQQVDRFLGFDCRKRPLTQIAFYGGNFLGLPRQTVTIALAQATAYVNALAANSLRFSTRPDTVTKQHIDLIEPYPVRTIELGLQSMNDRVLATARRGHTAAQSAAAVSLLKAKNYEVGVQLMVGLPGDNAKQTLMSARNTAELKPDFVRIYPTLVLRNSPLAEWYRKGTYTPLSLDEAVEIVKKMHRLFDRHRIPVVRMGLQATEGLSSEETVIAGPYHPSFGHMVQSQLLYDRALNALEAHAEKRNGRCEFRLHPRCESKFRGLGNDNLKQLQRRFPQTTLVVVPDDRQPKEIIAYRLEERGPWHLL
jgi:histone acetyltransferase (RNA polymerase elongator complex component)